MSITSLGIPTGSELDHCPPPTYTMSVQLSLATMQVNYSSAFVHADFNKPHDFDQLTPEEQDRSGVYVEMPRGFAKPGKVLKLKKSLYGLQQSPHNFFHYHKSKLEAIGFEQALDVDPCLLISDKVICLIWMLMTCYSSHET